MAAFDFPNSPSVNDQYTANGVTFKWNGTIWQRISASSGAQGTTGSAGPTGAQGAPAGLTISTSAPGSPSAGDMWWDSDAGLFLTYYNDGNSSQWVELNQGPKGAQGATGSTGAQGATGPTGAQGAAGAQGATGAAGSNASISSNADNRVITGGSGTNLVGESSLTYGSGLDVGGSGGVTISYSGGNLTMNSAGRIYIGNGGNGSSPMFANVSDTNTGIFFPAADTFAVTTGGTEKLRIDSSGTTFSFSPDSTTPNIKWRSNDTNWFGSLNQSVAGSTISTILSTGGDWSASGTTYSATKAIASFPTGALVLHNQYNSDATGAQLVFLNKAGGSSTTDGTVSERLRIHSTGRTQVNLPSTSGSSSAISTAQAIVGTKHIHTVYHNFNSTNSGLAINSVIPTNSTGTVDIMGGWANGNGITFKRFVWCASGDTAISQVFSTGASRYGVSVSISTPTMSISGDYVNFNFTFSDSQGSKMEKLKIHFEYHKQFYVI